MGRGTWGEIKRCSPNMAVCGLKVRMGDDKTALNGAMFRCCKLPDLPFNLPNPAKTESTVAPEESTMSHRIRNSNTIYNFVFGSNGM